MNIIVIDDNPHFRQDINLYLELKLNHKVIGEAGSGEEFLEMKNIQDADVILMDIAMDGMDGFTACKKALYLFPQLKTIAITMHSENIFLLKLIESGFKGFVNKTEIFTKIDTALQIVAKGHMFFPEYIISRIQFQ